MPPRERAVVGMTDATALARHMAEVRGTGGGWLNLMPHIDPDTPVPPTPSVLAVFSKRGPAVPLATWTPAGTGPRAEPTTVGVQHGVSSALTKRLATSVAAIPEGWRVVADHPRRGLVVQVPPEVGDHEVATWLLRVVDVVSVVPHTNEVDVYLY